MFIATRTQVYVSSGSPYFVIALQIEGPFTHGCTGSVSGCQIVELPTPVLEGGSTYTIYELGVGASTFGQTNLTSWLSSYIATLVAQSAYSGHNPVPYGPDWNATATCDDGSEDPFTGGAP